MMAVLNHPDTSSMDATLTRNWAVQVRLSSSDPWTFVQGLTGVNANMGEKQRQDGGDMHGGNYTGNIATEASWSLELTLQRKLEDGVPDPGVEILRSRQGELGADEFVHVRFWRTDDHLDSYQGRAGVSFQNAQGDKASLFGATVTLTGYQAYTKPPKPTDVETATSITVSPSDATIAADGVMQLIVKDNTGAIRTGDVAWTSDDEAAATVSATGLVSGVANGVATITATLAGVSPATCDVIVGTGTP
jgi:hypothetical protein